MNKKLKPLGSLLIAGILATSLNAWAADLPIENAILTDAPNVPPAITRTTPAKVIVDLDVIESVKEIADGIKYTTWTYGGSIPGKFIRVRQGDHVEFHMKNKTGNFLPHNIDLHAVTGPGGGAKVTLASPGEEAIFEWKALKSGIYIYHCATAPVPMHFSNGMYGLILVEPEKGMAKVDHEWYIVQSEFYTQKSASKKDTYEFSMEKMVKENPDYVLWNGKKGSLTGANSLKTKTGETVRLFVGNAGLNLVSSFHIIGDHLEKVYHQGSLDSEPLLNVQNDLIPAGAATMIETVFEVPGDYILVDHSLNRAFNKGCIGIISASGEPRPDLFKAVSIKPYVEEK